MNKCMRSETFYSKIEKSNYYYIIIVDIFNINLTIYFLGKKNNIIYQMVNKLFSCIIIIICIFSFVFTTCILTTYFIFIFFSIICISLFFFHRLFCTIFFFTIFHFTIFFFTIFFFTIFFVSPVDYKNME